MSLFVQARSNFMSRNTCKYFHTGSYIGTGRQYNHE